MKIRPLFKSIFTPVPFILSFSVCCAQKDTSMNYEQLRQSMVRNQIIARGITDTSVLDALLSVPRHLFIPEKYRDQAYEDHPLPIGNGQTISQPFIVAFMTEAISPDSTMKVLEIGTGSGYQAAVLSRMVKKVYSIEIVSSLGIQAETTLCALGYNNVIVKIGDGYKGWKEHAPYDAIIVTCAPEKIPDPLIEQLAENGKIIIPVGRSGIQNMVLLTKSQGKLIKNTILPVRFVPMVDSTGHSY